VPIALVGTAVAFLIGFKNNVCYDRLWEARRIWGGIVNESRSWGLMARDFPGNRYANEKLTKAQLEDTKTKLIYTHLAWLTALRHQLREPRVWETMNEPHNIEYRKKFNVREYNFTLEQELDEFLSKTEISEVISKKNRATQIVALQSDYIKELADKGVVDEFRYVELQKALRELLVLQGQCERIKNFPYPRQFATFNLYFVWIFIALLPFGMLQEFEKLGNLLVWLTVPFATLISWVFHSMEKIGSATENPFEGSANDVPITALSRTIEIDLREILNESIIPPAEKPHNNILL
jgi:putative membrane protein